MYCYAAIFNHTEPSPVPHYNPPKLIISRQPDHPACRPIKTLPLINNDVWERLC